MEEICDSDLPGHEETSSPKRPVGVMAGLVTLSRVSYYRKDEHIPPDELLKGEFILEKLVDGQPRRPPASE
jgi:hypothetical protein